MKKTLNIDHRLPSSHIGSGITPWIVGPGEMERQDVPLVVRLANGG